MASESDRIAQSKYKCLGADKWSLYPAKGDVDMDCYALNNVMDVVFCNTGVALRSEPGRVTVSGTMVFSAPPQTPVLLTTPSQLANKAYVDSVVSPPTCRVVNGFYLIQPTDYTIIQISGDVSNNSNAVVLPLASRLNSGKIFNVLYRNNTSSCKLQVNGIANQRIYGRHITPDGNPDGGTSEQTLTPNVAILVQAIPLVENPTYVEDPNIDITYSNQWGWLAI